jgi:hypothetical protein
MSRGLGALQRRVCEVLLDAGDGGLPPRELRRGVGDPDRSNLRRVVRGFLAHGVVEEPFRGGERRVALTDWGHTVAAAVARAGRRPGEKPRVYRGESTGGVHWFGHEHLPARGRLPGETQRAVLAALREGAGPPSEGLPVADVKAIVGSDPANTRRAIRSLLQRGLLEESADGRCVRLSPQGAFSSSLGF